MCLPEASPAAEQKVELDYRHASPQAVEAWRDMKYGLRIHWGVYSKLGLEASWALAREHKNDLEWQGWYHNLYKTFNPSEFYAEEWAELMVRSGLKFFVFTTKHHDGFSMFKTKTKVKRRFIYTGPNAGKIEECDLHYSIMETPYNKDIVGELVVACRKRGLGIGLYFSHIDWYDADFRLDQWNPLHDLTYSKETDSGGWARFVSRHREQIRELCTNYGKIDMISFDMVISLKWPGETLKLKSVRPRAGSRIFMLGVKAPLEWRMDESEGLIIEIPKNLQAEANHPCKQGYAFKIEGKPNKTVEARGLLTR